MEHDIVPRMMLAPKTSIEEHLPTIFKFFQQKVNHDTIDHVVDGNQAGEFFEHVLINSSTVASNDACDLMESTNSLKANLSIDFVKVSPYRPFGVYIFCTQGEDMDPLKPRQQLVVENPNAVLQLLFYFLQLPNEDQDLIQFAITSLTENFGYEQELNKNGLLLEKRVDLKHLNENMWTSKGNTGDAIRTSDKALFELVASAKWCLLAAEVAEKRKKENEDRIKESMRNYRSYQTKNQPKIIEDMIDEILEYKRKHGDGKIDYYEAFKLQNDLDDYKANVNRLEQAKVWDEIIEMVMHKDLPDDFEAWDELVVLATRFRRVYEPLDIANYYKHASGGGRPPYMAVRSKTYKFTQRWYEHANVIRFELVSESNFVAEVEELMERVVERIKTFEEINKDLEIIKNEVKKWQSDAKIQHKDVYWGDSIFSKIQEILAYGN